MKSAKWSEDVVEKSNLMKKQSLFYNSDYLSKKPCKYFLGYNKYYTKTGIILSLISLLSFVLMVYNLEKL